MKLVHLLSFLHDPAFCANIDITGVALDSRTVKPGDLFFACRGVHLDGREYVEEAIKNGASAVLLESDSYQEPFLQKNVPIFPVSNIHQKIGEIAARFYDDPAKKLKILGITGTNGKTSCAHFLAKALQHLQQPCGVIGTLGNGMYGHIHEARLTTPDAITLHQLFAQFVAEHAQYVAMEVSSHSLAQERVYSIEFAVAIFTNLTRDHLDYHGSMERYGAAKEKLFTNALTQHAVINVDDEFGKYLARSLAGKKNIITYSAQLARGIPPRDDVLMPLVYAKTIKLDLTGICADIVTPWGEGQLTAPLIGQFNLSNLLAVLTTLCLLDFPFEKVLASLAKLSPVPGRMQTFGGITQPLVVVDYAHTPDSLEKALIALREHCDKKLYCVFGCGGDRDRGKRPLMASIAEKYADQVTVTDDNPRTEDPMQIMEDIMQGFTQPKNISVQHDRSQAIRDAIQCAGPGDAVLIAGKGAETYQIIGEEKIPFSDVAKVKENLNPC